MAIDVQSELRRPIAFSLAIVAAVLLVWLLIVTAVHAKHRRAFEQQISLLQTEQIRLQNEIAQQQLATGTLSALQARIASTEQKGLQTTQAVEQVQARLAALRQEQQAAEQKTAEATREQQAQTQRLGELRTQVQEAEQKIAPLREAADKADQAAKARTQDLANVGARLEGARQQEAKLRGDLAALT